MSKMALRYGLLGDGIAYSLSPKIHTVSAKDLGLDISYELIDLERKLCTSFLSPSRQNDKHWSDFQGFNITVPYKEMAARSFESDFEAINCVAVDRRGRMHCKVTNTDGIGFFRSLQHLRQDWHLSKQMTFLGFGGAVKGILDALHFQLMQSHSDFKPSSITVLRRTKRQEAEQRYCQRFSGLGISLVFQEFCVEQFVELIKREQIGILVQGTDAPRKGYDLEDFSRALADHPSKTASCRLIVDLLYGLASSLVETGEKIGIPSGDGTGMLVEQARFSQEHWWQKSAPYELIYRELKAQ